MVIAAIAAGVIALLITQGFIKDVYHQFGDDLIHSQLGHAQLVRKDYFEKGYRTPEAFLIPQSEKLESTLASVPGVKAVMPRLDFSAMLNNGNAEIAVLAEGARPEQDELLKGGLKLLEGTRLSKDTKDGTFIGKGVADALKLKPGDTVTMMTPTVGGAMNSTELTVVGIFASAAKDYDDRAVRVSLPTAQDLLATNAVSRFLLLANERAQTDALATRLRAMYPGQDYDVRTWIELSDVYRNVVAAYEGQFGVIRFIILLLVVLSVANVVNMSIFERTGEFGTMRALGNDGWFVSKLIVVETALLGAVGAAVGVTLGWLLATVISTIGIPMPPPPNTYLGYLAQIRVDGWMLVVGFFIGFIAPLPACLRPALKVRKLDIVDALRRNI
jgi:putative ABC transport system permease protein